MNSKRHKTTLKRGDLVRFKPEYQDPGDENIDYLIVDDPEKGRVTVQAQLGLPINPTQVVNLEWIDLTQHDA